MRARGVRAIYSRQRGESEAPQGDIRETGYLYSQHAITDNMRYER